MATIRIKYKESKLGKQLMTQQLKDNERVEIISKYRRI